MFLLLALGIEQRIVDLAPGSVAGSAASDMDADRYLITGFNLNAFNSGFMPDIVEIDSGGGFLDDDVVDLNISIDVGLAAIGSHDGDGILVGPFLQITDGLFQIEVDEIIGLAPEVEVKVSGQGVGLLFFDVEFISFLMIDDLPFSQLTAFKGIVIEEVVFDH